MAGWLGAAGAAPVLCLLSLSPPLLSRLPRTAISPCSPPPPLLPLPLSSQLLSLYLLVSPFPCFHSLHLQFRLRLWRSLPDCLACCPSLDMKFFRCRRGAQADGVRFGEEELAFAATLAWPQVSVPPPSLPDSHVLPLLPKTLPLLISAPCLSHRVPIHTFPPAPSCPSNMKASRT